MSLLDSHEQITCAGEMLHQKLRQCKLITYHKESSLGYYLAERPGKRKILKRNKHRVLFEYLDWFYASYDDSSALGFKLMLDDINQFPDVVEYLRHQDVKVILLLRRNLVDRLISHALFSTREPPHGVTAKEKVYRLINRYRFARLDASGQLILNLNNSMKRLGFYENENAALKHHATQCETEVIYYEDLAGNIDECMRNVFPFLGISATNLSSSRKKVRTKNISDVVKNFSEFSKRLEGTRFQEFLK